MSKFQNSKLNKRGLFEKFDPSDFGLVSDWSETDASPEIRIWNFKSE
jgi:hypothetical protein